MQVVETTFRVDVCYKDEACSGSGAQEGLEEDELSWWWRKKEVVQSEAIDIVCKG